MRRLRSILIVAAAVVSHSAQAGPNLITNGSFETGFLADPTFFTSLLPGSTALTGWTIGGNAIDYKGTYWQASDGVRSVDLDASGSIGPGPYDGSISQSFVTELNQLYTLSFDLAGNPEGPPTIKDLEVSVAGTTSHFSFDTSGRSNGNMGYLSQNLLFAANGALTTLTFTSLEGTGYGPVIDNVRVEAVPETSSLALGLGGAILIASISRLRRRMR